MCVYDGQEFINWGIQIFCDHPYFEQYFVLGYHLKDYIAYDF